MQLTKRKSDRDVIILRTGFELFHFIVIFLFDDLHLSCMASSRCQMSLVQAHLLVRKLVKMEGTKQKRGKNRLDK